jgi:hypothetical protein
MALKDRIQSDRDRVFIQMNHFGTEHTWNGIPFNCVVDDDEALKRKNNNVNDISWDNNHTETFIYVREEDWPGRRVPNEHGFFDNRSVKIEQIHSNFGILGILLVGINPKPIAGDDF